MSKTIKLFITALTSTVIAATLVGCGAQGGDPSSPSMMVEGTRNVSIIEVQKTLDSGKVVTCLVASNSRGVGMDCNWDRVFN